MKLVRLDSLFDVNYGHSLELCYQEETQDGVWFVSRTDKNCGRSGRIKPIKSLEPAPAGSISVALSGTVLATFLQSHPYYTGYHVAILTPKIEMTHNEKLYYVKCIRKNKFRFSYGRQANRTLPELMLPALSEILDSVRTYVPEDLSKHKEPKLKLSEEEREELWSNIKWGTFRLLDYFMYFKQSNGNSRWCEDNPGDIRYLTATTTTNGVSYKVDKQACVSNKYPIYLKGITITTDGQPCWAFYQDKPFMLGSNVIYIKPINGLKLSKLQSLFVCTMIRKEAFRFNYGRKLNTERLEKLTIGLPKDKDGHPNWDLIEILAASSDWTAYM